ncbi:MAG: MFS transporter [Patescibacteria group bacterium]
MDLKPINITPKRSSKSLLFVYLANLFLSFHLYLILYINSSFLEKFFSSTALSWVYIVGSILNLILLLAAPRLIKKIGIYSLTILFIVLEGLAIFGLSLAQTPALIACLSVLHLAVIAMIFFGLDIFLEEYSPLDETKTGSIRGTFLTISNVTLVIAPMIAGFILVNGDFSKIYLTSFLFLIPLLLTLIIGLRNNADKIPAPLQNKISFKNSIQNILHNKNLHGIFMVQFILQFFYAWMVIYVPIHLHQNLGFSWPNIGLIFTIMLLPFVLFELPIGKLEDKKLGEKEVMILGFIITALSVAFIPFLKEASLIIWAILLFITRTGASFIEISAESYFFKHVNSTNADTISLFRMTRPLSFIIAPAIAASTLFLLNYLKLGYGLSFIILSIIVFYGIRYSLMITNTKNEK